MTLTADLPTKWLFATIILLLSFHLEAQVYLVSYTDKSDSPYSIHYPEAFLSDRAIIRRLKHAIPIEESDLPVNLDYINELNSLESVSVLYSTKWLNASVARIDDSLALEKIIELGFVKKVSPLKNYYKKRSFDFSKEEETKEFKANAYNETSYGASYRQTEMLNLHKLHEQGLTGKGMVIAVIDGGFNDLYQLSHFDSIRLGFRLLAQRDYVDLDHSSVDGSWHGMHVMSCMASYKEGLLIGTAPGASYVLLRTEDVNSETPLEELNWVKAAEFADSLGADILNTSLGYTDYFLSDGTRDSLVSYEWDDLDGSTSYITKASDLAARKGMLVVNSAGNSGNGAWKYIGMPADGDSVLAIGALDSVENKIGFSSYGRPEDSRVKPNVMAMGFQVVLAHKDANDNDTVRIGSGTSFAGPILAGAAACLWQAKPELSNMEIFDIIQRSSDSYNNPDTAYGYGLPDFQKALDMALENEINYDPSYIYPNPFQDYLIYQFETNKAQTLRFEIFNLQGKLVFEDLVNAYGKGEYAVKTKALRNGMYVLVVSGPEYEDRKLILRNSD